MNHLGEYVASYGYHVGMGQNSIPLKSDGSYQEFPYFRAILGHSADMAGSPHQTARAGERTDGPWGLPDLASGSLFQVVVGRGLEQVFPRFLTGPPWVLVQYCPLCRLVANRYSTTKRCCLNQKNGSEWGHSSLKCRRLIAPTPCGPPLVLSTAVGPTMSCKCANPPIRVGWTGSKMLIWTKQNGEFTGSEKCQPSKMGGLL